MAVCRAGPIDLGAWMVENGWAVAFWDQIRSNYDFSDLTVFIAGELDGGINAVLLKFRRRRTMPPVLLVDPGGARMVVPPCQPRLDVWRNRLGPGQR